MHWLNAVSSCLLKWLIIEVVFTIISWSGERELMTHDGLCIYGNLSNNTLFTHTYTVAFRPPEIVCACIYVCGIAYAVRTNKQEWMNNLYFQQIQMLPCHVSMLVLTHNFVFSISFLASSGHRVVIVTALSSTRCCCAPVIVCELCLTVDGQWWCID